MDGATELQVFLRVFLPMNWGVTTALAIITFIGAWNLLPLPFLVAQDEKMMTVTVGIAAVQDAYGVSYGRILGGLSWPRCRWRLPICSSSVGSRRAITLSAGIKG